MIALAVVRKEFSAGPGTQDEIHFREDDAGARPSSRWFRTGRAAIADIEGERLSAQSAHEPHPRRRLHLRFDERCIGRFKHIAVRRRSGGCPLCLCSQSRVDIVHSGLKPDRPNARQTQHLSTLLVSDVTSIHHPPIGLLDAVAIDRIVEKERKIREQVKPVILPIRIGKNCPPDIVS